MKTRESLADRHPGTTPAWPSRRAGRRSAHARRVGRTGSRSYAIFNFDGTGFTSFFDATTLDDDQTMALSLNTPRFREGAQQLHEWDGGTDETPPVTSMIW
jgi:hypothetical protein